MIHSAPTIIIALIVLAIVGYAGLVFVRKFALQIAQENHEAMLAMDQADEEKRLKREKEADAAVGAAYANVEPLLTESKSSEGDATSP